MVDLLNVIAEHWFTWQFAMLWQTAVLIGIIWVADMCIRKWAHPQLRYTLWMLILVKLLVPPTWTCPVSITSHIPVLAEKAVQVDFGPESRPEAETITELESLPLAQAPQTNFADNPLIAAADSQAEVVAFTDAAIPVQADVPAEATAAESREVVQPSTLSAGLSANAYGLLVWLGGVGLLCTWLMRRLSGLRKEHLTAEGTGSAHLPAWFDDLLAKTAGRLGVKRLPRVVLTDKVACPAVFGLLRPVLLIPAGKLKHMTARDTEHILLHELAHIKRGDLWVHAVAMTLHILYWFNPLLWLIRRPLQNLRELCCDATVAKLLKEKTPQYRETLLETARQLLAEPVDPGLGLLGLFENNNWLLTRLQWLEKNTWKNRKLRLVTIVALIGVMATCVMPMANRPKKDDSGITPIPAKVQWLELKQTEKSADFHIRFDRQENQRICIYSYGSKLIQEDGGSIEPVSSFAGPSRSHFGNDRVDVKGKIFCQGNTWKYEYATHDPANKNRAIGNTKGTMGLISEGTARLVFFESLQEINSLPNRLFELQIIKNNKIICRHGFIGQVNSSEDGSDLGDVQLRRDYIKNLWELKHTQNSESKAGKYKATLPNGVTVELLGLCSGMTEQDRVWWLPDGQIQKTDLFEEYNKDIKPKSWDDRQFMYAYLYRVISTKVNDSDSDVSAGVRWHGNYSGGDVCIGYVYSDAERVDNFPSTGGIKIAIAAGDFQSFQSKLHRGTVSDASFLKDGKTNVTVSGPRITSNQQHYLDINVNSNEFDIQVDYELNNGGVKKADRDGRMGGPHITSFYGEQNPILRYDFSVRDDWNFIKHFVIQYRKYELATFKNIALRGGMETEVEIESQLPVSSLQPSGGSRKSPCDQRMQTVTFKKDMYLVDALQMLSKMYRVNIVPSQDILYANTIIGISHLYDVTFEDVLKAVCGTSHVYVEKDNLIYVYTKAEYDELGLEGGHQQFNCNVPFEITRQGFLENDGIEITEISGSSGRLKVGQTYRIKGRYTLESENAAMLHIYATNGETRSEQGPVVQRGSGEFVRTFTYLKEGWLHLSFYPADGGSSFGNLYFAEQGSNQQVPEMSNISSSVKTAATYDQHYKQWVEKIASLTDHKRAAFVVVPQLLEEPPDFALKVVREAWPDVDSYKARQGVMKAFHFAEHPHTLAVLDLGVRDVHGAVVSYALTYVSDYSGVTFPGFGDEYVQWYEANKDKPLEQILEEKKSTRHAVHDETLEKMIAAFKPGARRDDYGQYAETLGDAQYTFAIPAMIGMIDGDNSYDTIYWVGYFGLTRITGVDYSPFHDGAWWRRWWQANKSRYPSAVQETAIPDLPKTAHGMSFTPYPADIDTPEGMIRWMLSHYDQLLKGYPDWSDVAEEFSQWQDPKAIPYLIAAMDADAAHDLHYDIGYHGLDRLTGVPYDKSHDAAWWTAWWTAWWQKNKSRYPEDVQALDINEIIKQYLSSGQ